MYKQTEINYSLIIILLVISAFIILSPELAGLKIIILSINLLITLLFFSLTIVIDKQKLRWYFGFGIISKSVELSQIDDTSTYQTKWYQGIGIRMLSDGWLYNASVGKAVKITLTDGKNIYLGCKNVEALQKALKVNV
ncbi:hypothetical protein E5N72_17660 [Pseudoalteromonas sp. MEBiC 03607]|uniref:hypothetical protein n=1 Tax=Pseudoalteromonas TaxID=53246 RepID=UPI000EC6E0FF|nr:MULTISPECIES: hypothetical protein [unclassified Pseudoalteromonas]MCF2920047.1 hypothetical protein [Pseudoalteromonas sp. APAL1]TGV17059.1 hypothetical protein E5N72_17660 [Pseudoalteromonas sp. MEBiC 03607]HCV04170.1 hypothetical protein [Pseudoalteromonas sp.]|tara:strand:+ start:186 stop:599 length:414 start_codon:yes stop_codon:yes gene_type:complete